jgi:hypothetical protein
VRVGCSRHQVGSDSMVTLSRAEAEAAVPRRDESEVCTAAAVVEAGTAMVAVMSTLLAETATSMVTAEASTPAAEAIEPCREAVSV